MGIRVYVQFSYWWDGVAAKPAKPVFVKAGSEEEAAQAVEKKKQRWLGRYPSGVPMGPYRSRKRAKKKAKKALARLG